MNPRLVILAAGLSRRFGSLKQLAPVGPGGEALLDYTLYDAARAGFSGAVLVVGEAGREEVAGHVSLLTGGALPCSFVVQDLNDLPGGFRPPDGRVRPWGTAHALLTAEPFVDGPFVVLNADDFYGRGVIGSLGAHLRSLDNIRATDFAMPAYRLADTLSEAGGVSRAVCEVDGGGWLVGVQELLDVRREDDSIRARRPNTAETVTLTGAEPVSRNIWALTPAVFSLLREQLADFLTVRGSDREAEFYLSSAIDGQIRAERATVRVHKAESPAFGVTFPDDVGPCAERIAELVAAGAYPGDLREAFTRMAAHDGQESTCC